MRAVKISLIFLFLMFLFVPYIVFLIMGEKPSEIPDSFSEYLEISVYRTESKEIENVSCYEYICASLCGEMPATYEAEALKAQAVACYTYMLGRMNYVVDNPDADIGHNGAYVCDDSSHCMAYLDRGEAKAKWGSTYFDKNYKNIEDAVSQVLGDVITYGGQPVNAVFHSLSGGQTQSAQEVWGSEVPYLVSVESHFDEKAEDFETTAVFSKKDFMNVFSEQLGVTLPKEPDCWIGEIVKTDSGMVKQITVADTVYSGTFVRKLFELRSSCFDVSLEDDSIIFTVYGYGHGVGMSQNGANMLAKDGYNYKEILKYYYTDTEVEHQNN